MDRKTSVRRRPLKPFAERAKDHCRQFTAFMFSNVGIIILVVVYMIGGKRLFCRLSPFSKSSPYHRKPKSPPWIRNLCSAASKPVRKISYFDLFIARNSGSSDISVHSPHSCLFIRPSHSHSSHLYFAKYFIIADAKSSPFICDHLVRLLTWFALPETIYQNYLFNIWHLSVCGAEPSYL